MMTIGRAFGFASVLTLAALLSGGAAAQTPEKAHRLRITVQADGAIVAAATWLGVEGRTSKITHSFETPYQRDLALGPDGADAEGILDGTLDISVRPFRYQGTLCLDVELHGRTAGDLHHYRSDSLLEILPAMDSYSLTGSFCDSRAQDGGLIYSLDVGRPEDGFGTTIFVSPAVPVKHNE